MDSGGRCAGTPVYRPVVTGAFSGRAVFVVLVEFEIRSGYEAVFRDRVLRQAADSLALEPGCQVFDVCVDAGKPDRFLLYEIYDDEASFGEHLESRHFKAFDTEVSEWIETKNVSTFGRLN